MSASDTKFRWRRAEKATGLMAIGFNNSKRDWDT